MKQNIALEEFLAGRHVVIAKFEAHHYKEVQNKAKKVVRIVNLYDVQCADGKHKPGVIESELVELLLVVLHGNFPPSGQEHRTGTTTRKTKRRPHDRAPSWTTVPCLSEGRSLLKTRAAVSVVLFSRYTKITKPSKP